MKKILVLGVITFVLTGCVTTDYNTRTDRAIESGVKWGAVGAATGALVGVAANTHVDRAAALGALVAGVPAMVVEMVSPPPPPSPTVAVPSCAPVHLPGPKEIFISGWLEPEVKWEVVRELRALGYQVTEEHSAPLQLRLEMRGARDPKYVCVAYLVDRASNRILAQGRGEVRLTFITEERRIQAQKQAAIAAIRSLN